MTRDCGILPDQIDGEEATSEGHFIVEGVDSPMTEWANSNATGEFLLGVIFFEAWSSMDFSGNEMVKGEGHLSLAELTRVSTRFLLHSRLSTLPRCRDSSNENDQQLALRVVSSRVPALSSLKRLTRLLRRNQREIR